MNASAQFDSWISPGDLSEPHVELKGITQCTQCHSTSKGVPEQKCLACHKEIQKKLEARKGFHAKQKDTCSTCHNEHKGVSFDLMGLTRKTFDHNDTGWTLTGKHVPLDCDKCHTQKRKHAISGKLTSQTTYLEAPSQCESCHTDIHNSKRPLFKKCQNCHSTSSWDKNKRLVFNHNRQTNYKLTGQHQDVTCESCHKTKVWAPIAFQKCTDCHTDPHNGDFGNKCVQCHSTLGWKSTPVEAPAQFGKFNHQKTNFPLTGQHIKVTCLNCHGPKIGKMKNFDQCSGCHNNPHGNQFQTMWKNKKCTDCHLTDGWQILDFQHNTDSRYFLEDQHTLVPCEKCHFDRKYRQFPNKPDCAVCHFDTHRGQFSPKSCATCHSVKGFEFLQFDHNKNARFPLIGKHSYTDCYMCHKEGQYKPIDTSCSNCHNDFHKGELGKECVRCHNPQAFNQIEFEHNRGSRFQLTGKHQTVNCNQCHAKYKYKIGMLQCSECHNDVHKNSFGKKCETCHNTSNFKVSTGFHNFGEYTLGGIHDRLDCLVCHGPKPVIRTLEHQCSNCHKDPHMNSFGNTCYTCHGQNSWLPSTFRHNQTGFELSGAHRFVECNRCHVNRIFGGLPNECAFCHLKDYAAASAIPAHATSGLQCNNCHRTYGWRPTK